MSSLDIKKIIQLINVELNIAEHKINNTINLLSENCTIPFISRYRKEFTGGLDESQIEDIQKAYNKFKTISERKDYITEVINSSGQLTEKLKSQIENTWDINELEDIYLPYKPKKRTKASIAREKGLEDLAKRILSQSDFNPEEYAQKFINKEVPSIKEAIEGASDIIAEIVSEDKKVRELIRAEFSKSAVISSKPVKSKKDEADKYKDYFEFSQNLDKCPSHRVLAILRAEKEGFLKTDISIDNEVAESKINKLYLRKNNSAGKIVKNAIADSYKRLIKPSIENEFAKSSKLNADIKAIDVFKNNLKQLLLAPPLGQKRIMGIDPGYRTGCKVVCIDETGNLLHNDNIYPHKPQSETKVAAKKIVSLAETYNIKAIAIGNGTASRETENFIKKLKFKDKIQIFVVSEDGASVYSASKTAREEFPQYDVTVRGAVSIARRLMDPLAELVKIDPKSIGVGQYQHDVDQKLLKESLDRTVESCVNSVGVNLNTASKHLLTYIAGLGPSIAENIVQYRKENGLFNSRKELLNVKRLGDNAYLQCAGFLRIKNAENPLDNTAVHPEAYHKVKEIAQSKKMSTLELIGNNEVLEKINPEDYIDEKFGLPSLQDILKEIKKPGLDPRSVIKVFEFDKTIYKIEDLKQGMIVPGIVTNVTNFGAFVDIGIKENGLIHISQIADRYVSNPAEVLSIHQQLSVKIIEVDIERKRIQLSLKGVEQ